MTEPFGAHERRRGVTERAGEAATDVVVTSTDGRRARPDGFDGVYRAEYHALLRLAVLTTSSTELAEELVQDTFAALLATWSTVDRPAAWLRTALVHRCTSWVRRIAVERRYAPRLRAADTSTDPDRLAVADLLCALRPLERAVLVLRFVDGWSEADVAEALDVPLGTVKSTASRARARLRHEIEEERR